MASKADIDTPILLGLTQMVRSLWGPVLGGALIIAAAILCGVIIGETPIPIDVVLKTLANNILGTGYVVDPIDAGLLWNYRLTRAIIAACCGAGLAISGVALQALLRNALAEPYLLGISAGASTGAVLATVAGLGGGAVSLSAGAFAGALTAFGIVMSLAHFAGGNTARHGSVQIVLAGIAGSQLFNALTAFIIAKSANAEQAKGIMFWLMGNLSGVRWPDVQIAVPVVVAGLIVIAWHARKLDAFTFGADAAASVGVPVRRVQTVLIMTTALLTAAMVSIVGSIGFVGLVIPHMARFIVGHSHGRLIPTSAVAGAVFLIGADIASRILIPGQVLPIGVITALIGAPTFAIILIRGQRT